MGPPPVTHRYTRYVLWFFVIVALGLSIGTLLLVNDIHRLEDQNDADARATARALRAENARQDQAIVRARRAEYRLCLRGQVTRAALNIHAARDHHRLVLPLYDCTPNITGGPAARLSPAQTRAFEHYVQTSKSLP